jgi:hypothetical protein
MAVEYFNVLENKEALAQMLKHSGGERVVPVIVEGNRVTLGYAGGS